MEFVAGPGLTHPLRLPGGVFSGFIGVIHSVVGELSDKTNQSTAFPLYDIISALGFVIGYAIFSLRIFRSLRVCSPIIGGAFAEPATEYGGWFNNSFLRAYPYILPAIVTAILTFGSTLLSLFVLREVTFRLLTLGPLLILSPRHTLANANNHRHLRAHPRSHLGSKTSQATRSHLCWSSRSRQACAASSHYPPSARSAPRNGCWGSSPQHSTPPSSSSPSPPSRTAGSP